MESEEIKKPIEEEITEEVSVNAMLYDVKQMVKELNSHTKKSRYKSLAVTTLEEVENWLRKELNK